jgi:uncharacterized protein YyaL (SSP411 family)
MSRTPPPDAKPNRLARATSPYLLQHRFNPVDWFEWGPEAFAEARRRNVPVFLSVGYSTCYWCHVMERESFEDEGIGRLMSESFVCIKVDREERPDVDEVYMTAVQAFTGRGGWPMSVFLEPATLKPFWAGTYFPARPTHGSMPTFPQVLGAMREAWATQRHDVLKQADELADAVRERAADSPPPVRLGQEHLARAVQQLVRLLDRVHGGFGSAPKFPQPVFIDLLLAARAAAGDDDTRAAIDQSVSLTLTRMAEGGLFDQVGGGFHRYSVDEKWLVPHFEKMLYDNALLASTYADAHAVLADPLLARTARRTCEYALREMLAPGGAFFAAQDAEVNHREGQNYLWTSAQIDAALSADDAAWIKTVYGLDLGPNFRDPHHPSDTPANILFIAPKAHAAGRLWADADALARLDRINQTLYDARAKRDQPGTDDKVLASWNGLMIAGLARVGSALAEPRFLNAARAAADFVLAHMRTPDGRLHRSFAGGKAQIPGFLEDHAFVAWGLVQLHQASPSNGSKYLDAARELVGSAKATFGDGQGGFFDTPAGHRDLFVRTRSVHDGALPSAQAVLLHTFIDLAVATGDRAYARDAAALLVSISGHIHRSPLGCAASLRALLRLMLIDPHALADAQRTLPAPAAVEDPSDEFSPVEILCEADQITVPADQPVGLTVRVRIAEGYHLTANRPGADNLVPFSVFLASGSGIRVYADYPEGHDLPSQPGVKVYSGEFDLPIILERAGDWNGNPILGIAYQACTDTACLQPARLELDLEIERGGA